MGPQRTGCPVGDSAVANFFPRRLYHDRFRWLGQVDCHPDRFSRSRGGRALRNQRPRSPVTCDPVPPAFRSCYRSALSILAEERTTRAVCLGNPNRIARWNRTWLSCLSLFENQPDGCLAGGQGLFRQPFDCRVWIIEPYSIRSGNPGKIIEENTPDTRHPNDCRLANIFLSIGDSLSNQFL